MQSGNAWSCFFILQGCYRHHWWKVNKLVLQLLLLLILILLFEINTQKDKKTFSIRYQLVWRYRRLESVTFFTILMGEYTSRHAHLPTSFVRNHSSIIHTKKVSLFSFRPSHYHLLVFSKKIYYVMLNNKDFSRNKNKNIFNWQIIVYKSSS